MNNKLYCINPNTKEYEEVKSICGISIEEILDLIRDYKISKDLKFDKFGRLEEIEQLQDRINKAIKYTKQFTNGKTSSIDEWKNVELVLETILDILKGEDKE